MHTPEQLRGTRPEQSLFDETIGSFDFDELDNIVSDLARSTGYYDTSPRVLRHDSFYELTTSKKGDYNPKDKHIGIGLRKIKQNAREAGVEAKRLTEHAIVHEETHAISGQHCLDSDNEQVGFDKTKNGSRVYWLWNEGVTEKLAREIYGKYALAKHTATPEEIDLYMEKVAAYGRNNNEFYQPEIDLVDKFIGLLAREIGIEAELVWKSIKQGLLKGEEWNSAELEELSKDILPPNFMEEIENLGTHMAAKRLTQELSRKEVAGVLRTSKISRKILRGLEKLVVKSLDLQ